MDRKKDKQAHPGKLRLIRLISNNICFGPSPGPDDIVEQHLSIRSDGRVWLSSYRYGTEHEYPKAGSKQRKIPRNQAEYILSLIQSYFASYERWFVTDVGMWTLELISDEGEKAEEKGSLIPNDGELRDISSMIRTSLDMPDLFCFDGAYRPDRIESIKIEYHRVTKIRPRAIPEGAAWEYLTWDYREHMYFDRKTETIEHFQKIAEECDITRTYHIGEGISDFLDRYDAASLFSEVEGNPDDVTDNPMEEKTYRIELGLKYSEPRTVAGTYDKRALPKDWPEFMDDVREFIRFYGMGEIMDPDVYGQARRRRGEFIFAFVAFEDGGQEYAYLCGDESVGNGDLVLVPVGNDGKTAIAAVTRIEYHPAEEAPYPMDKIKSIIRLLHEDEMDSPK